MTFGDSRCGCCLCATAQCCQACRCQSLSQRQSAPVQVCLVPFGCQPVSASVTVRDLVVRPLLERCAGPQANNWCTCFVQDSLSCERATVAMQAQCVACPPGECLDHLMWPHFPARGLYAGYVARLGAPRAFCCVEWRWHVACPDFFGAPHCHACTAYPWLITPQARAGVLSRELGASSSRLLSSASKRQVGVRS